MGTINVNLKIIARLLNATIDRLQTDPEASGLAFYQEDSGVYTVYNKPQIARVRLYSKYNGILVLYTEGGLWNSEFLIRDYNEAEIDWAAQAIVNSVLTGESLGSYR